MLDILFSHSYYYKFDSKQWKNKTPYPPLGTLYAASYLRENGYNVGVFDANLLDDPIAIKPYLETHQPRTFVLYDDGFNYLTKMCLTTMREAAFKMIKIAKALHCNVIVCSSDSTDHYEKYLSVGADYIIQGEGEITLKELVDGLENKTDISQIKGLIFKNADGIIKNPKRNVLKDLDQFPMPAWDLIDVELYRDIWESGGNEFTLNMATTRGCPFKCNWCAKPIYGNRYNAHSAKYIVNLIEDTQSKFGYTHIWFADDIFGLKPNWLKEFSELIEQKNIKIKYNVRSSC